ncbi:MAG: hypothetical protein DHS20C11_02870 [Lysobacteraceae bacterium]|nr:MAG: hypothetical protein DHS20C11_02870 [Xanthomonadaceae bacterium]
MKPIISEDRLRFLIAQVRQRLWVKPLVVCLLSIAAAFVAKLADGTTLAQFVPAIAEESIETLLSIMAASMLGIAVFAVGSMVSAYASAASTATPRSFSLVVADDVSQNALSTFVGAFIFSIVSITALKNDYFQAAGLFILFTLTACIFGLVIIMFLRWVDRIARLGRLGSTIDAVEEATASALRRRRNSPTLCGIPSGHTVTDDAVAIYADAVGYIQHVDIAALQAWASDQQCRLVVEALPGTFASPDRPLALVVDGSSDLDASGAISAFEVGSDRLFDDDPRLGLVVLSEIAARALSPAVNDPGTAIDIIGTLVRLFSHWAEDPETPENAPNYDRVEVPAMRARDMFDDAFTAIARDGAACVEVGVRLQKALTALAAMGNADMREAASYHAEMAIKRAEQAIALAEDLQAVRDARSL